MASSAPGKQVYNNDDDTELQSADQISISIDLVSAAKHFLGFLKTVSGLPHLHGGPLITQAIKRYRNYWMPLASKIELVSGKNILPPLDVQWVWLCHCLNPKSYQHFCKTHYFKIIDFPVFLDLSSETSARERCRSLWNESYPNEPFEIRISQKNSPANFRNRTSQTHWPSQSEEKELMEAVLQQSAFYSQVSQPYMYHDDFLKVAKERYKCFLYMLHKLKGRTACMPTSDIQLMWKTHQMSPVAYAFDTERISGSLENNGSLIQKQLHDDMLQAFKNTARTWEILFGHPYERAGAVCRQVNIVGTIAPLDTLSESIPVSVNWHHQNTDLNSKHESLTPRYVVEVCIHAKSTKSSEKLQGDVDDLFVRMRMMEACKFLRQDVQIQSYQYDMAWHKLWWMQCEVSSKGLVLELRSHTTKCLGAPWFSKLLGQATLIWKELESEANLASEKPLAMKKRSHVSESWIILTSITPPIQAPYLLKAFSDQVTDDAGAMLSKMMLRLNKYKPQEGRWMSRTVLNHAGKECFIIRIRVAAGVWRSKNERPVGVDWNERIIHVHGGGWNYITGSIGIAPDEILATATPVADELEQYKMKWSFSTGETLTIQMPIEDLEWERHLRFSVKGNPLGMVRLLNGRHMQYEVPSAVPEEEEGFVTLVRYTAQARQGRATALFNWKMSAMEVLPEEDAVLVMLICTATQRGVADLGGRTLRNFYRRKAIRKEIGKRDWGSVVMGGGQDVPSELMFWYVNPEEVLRVNLNEVDNEEVLPKGASEQMYRGTSWLYAGSTKGLYKMASKGSCESIGCDGGDHLFGPASLSRFGSQIKVPAVSR